MTTNLSAINWRRWAGERQREFILLALSLLLPLLPANPGWGSAWHLVAGAYLVFFGPGFILRDRLALWPTVTNRFAGVCFAFALSYALNFLVNVVVTLGELNLQVAAIIIVGLNLTLIFLPRPPAVNEIPRDDEDSPSSRWDNYTLLALLTFTAVLGWMIEVDVAGEEIIELVTIKKLAENSVITLYNVLHTPGEISIYIFTPYYFAVALIAKLAHLSPMAVYVKMRALYFPLAILATWAIVLKLTRSTRAATAVALGEFAMIFVQSWEWSVSLFPVVSRGGITAGVLFPIAIFLLLQTRDARAGGGLRRMIEILLPALFVGAMLSSHALEVVYVLFFIAALMCAGWVSPRRDLKTDYPVLGAVLVSIFTYLSLHHHLVTYIHVHLKDQVAALKIDHFLQVFSENHWSVFWLSPPSEIIKWLLTGLDADGQSFFPFVSMVLPFLLLPLVARTLPTATKLLWFCLAIPILAFSSTVGPFLMERYVGIDYSHVHRYFAYFGVVITLTAVTSLSLALAAWLTSKWVKKNKDYLAVAVAVVLAALAGFGLGPPLLALRELQKNHYLLPLLLAGLSGAAIFWQTRPLRGQTARAVATTSYPWLAPALMLAFTLPVFWQFRTAQEHGTLLTAARLAHRLPTVTDSEAYYPRLQKTASPPIDLPWATLNELRPLIKDMRILAYDPQRAYSIPALLDVYIAAVYSASGYFTDLFGRQKIYMAQYVRHLEDGGLEHPLFNQGTILSNEDEAFIRDYHVQYILTNPVYNDAIRAKVAAQPARFRELYNKQGFSLFEVVE